MAVVGAVRAQPHRGSRRTPASAARSTASWPPIWCATSPTRTGSCGVSRLAAARRDACRPRVLGARLADRHRGVERRVRDGHHPERPAAQRRRRPLHIPPAQREPVRRRGALSETGCAATASTPCAARRCPAGSETSCTPSWGRRHDDRPAPRDTCRAARSARRGGAAEQAARRRRRRRHRRTGRGDRTGRARRRASTSSSGSPTSAGGSAAGPNRLADGTDGGDEPRLPRVLPPVLQPAQPAAPHRSRNSRC